MAGRVPLLMTFSAEQLAFPDLGAKGLRAGMEHLRDGLNLSGRVNVIKLQTACQSAFHAFLAQIVKGPS